MNRLLSLIGLLLILSACGVEPIPTRTYTIGDPLLSEDFSNSFGWEQYDQSGARLQMIDGVYRVQAQTEGAFAWGLKAQNFTDTVIEARVSVNSADTGNGYGLMCRASPSSTGEGYYFLVGTDGTYTIRVGDDQQVEALVAWAHTDRLDRTIGAQNVLRAVCVADYLALYVNGWFVAEARDDRYRSGYAGIAYATARNESILVEFDDFRVWEAD
ncbi:MAG: hypothetical protein MUF87_04740 [Anaerolineae bacterium]|jgi:hypothetical protein|nr:hypothetical protein [Anaerolineae bacterium]